MKSNIKLQIGIVGLFVVLIFIITNYPKQYEKIENKVLANDASDMFNIEQKAKEEYEWNVVNKKFGFIIAKNDKKIIYVEYINFNNPKCKKYIRQYDIAKNKSSRILENVFITEIPSFPWAPSDYKKDLTAKSGEVIVDSENGFIVIEIDFYNAIYKKIASIPRKYTQINHIELVPNSNKICYSYYMEGQTGESIDVFDLKTDKIETILQNIIYRNPPFSSTIQWLPFILIKDKAILYVENVNAKPREKLFYNPNEYRRLSVIYLDSKQIKEIASTKGLSNSTTLQIKNNKIIWNDKIICDYKDIIR